MLAEIFEQLDQWICTENAEAALGGTPRIAACEIKVLGQSALLEAGVDLALAATRDLDLYANYPHAVEMRFRELLRAHDMVLDPVGHEVWMPSETQYTTLYESKYVIGKIAQAEYVLLSKAARAPRKNRALIVEYLAKGASPLFFELAERHQVNLESFV